MMDAGTLLRIWLAGGIGLVGLLAVYEYAPILLPMGVIAAGLGALTFAIVALARAIERRRARAAAPRDDA